MSTIPADERAVVFAQLRAVMSRVLGVPEEKIGEDTTRAQIDRWDSLNMVTVAIGLERRLKRVIDPELLVDANSVRDLLDALCSADA
jgi:acyl carrier protein